MDKKLVTILTPVYNRENEIKRLYKSLVRQTDKGFEWLLIDDGSTDRTKEAVNRMINEKKIDIRYEYKENGGKHTALNLGIAKIDTPLTFIVDSDDWLTNDAVENIYNVFQKKDKERHICGYVFLRRFPNGKINGAPFPILVGGGG